MKKWIGYVRLRLTGLDIERQIKKILSLGIVMGNCRRESFTCFSFDVLPWEVRKIRREGIAVRTDVRGGLTVALYSLRKRAGLYIGIAVALALMLFLQGRVLVFEINGNAQITDQMILEMMGAQSIVGRQVDGDMMESIEESLMKNDNIQWVSVSRSGIKMTVTVKEKPALPEDPNKASGDIVASKVGIIEELTVLQGVAQVTEGKLVLPGEVLISGQLIYAGEPADYVAAMGKCMAKVWYSVEKEVSLTKEVITETGNTFISKSVMLFDNEFGAEAPPFENYSVTETVKPISQIGVPIFTVERIYSQQTVSYETVTAEQALQENKEELERGIKSILPNDTAEISFYCQQTENGAVVGVSAVALEDIGIFKQLEESN